MVKDVNATPTSSVWRGKSSPKMSLKIELITKIELKIELFDKSPPFKFATYGSTFGVG